MTNVIISLPACLSSQTAKRSILYLNLNYIMREQTVKIQATTQCEFVWLQTLKHYSFYFLFLN